MANFDNRRSRTVMWRRTQDDLSFEHARLSRNGGMPEISGSIVIAEQGIPLDVQYRVVCDGDWGTRAVEVEQAWSGERRTFRLEHDGRGQWRRNGQAATELAGCTDVDLSVTPSTNALPINRLRLPVGGRGEVIAAWVRFPELDITPGPQSYERLGESRYRYTSLASGFTAFVDVDADGLPTEYAGVWRRVAEGPAVSSGSAQGYPDGGRAWLRHCLATLAYRAGKAMRDAPQGFGECRPPEPTAMTAARIAAHMGDLMEWALSMAEGREQWRNSGGAWDDEVNRFFGALGKFDAYLASASPLHAPAERLFQGPIADALTHVGQLATRRRLAGTPVRGENYFVAEITTGRVGLDQAAPVRESRIVPAQGAPRKDV